MRILIYSINFSPELVGIGKYTGEMATWFAAAQGHQVRVVTAPPYYPAWRVWQQYHAYRYQRETPHNNLAIWRCPLWVPQHPTGIKRILHLLSFAISSSPVVLWQNWWRPDVIIVIEPPLSCVPTALLTAYFAKSKACLHVQDFEVDAAFDLNLLQSSTIRRLMLAIERWLMRRFDQVSTISERMCDKLRQKGVASERIYLFPNWVDTQQIYPLSYPSPFRQVLQIPDDKVVLLYSGNMGAKQGLEIIIDAAKQLHVEPRYIFVMCGEGAAYPQLRQQSDGLSNILWLPLQPIEKLNDLLNLADIHLLPQRADAADLVMPSKLGGMLASGRPIIATANSGTQIAQVVENTGIVVPPNDVEKLVQAIVHLAQDSTLRKKFGNEGYQYAAENLGRDKILKKFEERLHYLIAKE